MSERFSGEELAVIRTVFDSCDGERNGLIHINQLPVLLSKLGKSDDEITPMTESASKIADEQEGRLNLQNVINVLEMFYQGEELPFEGADPKVLEFLRILEEYRIKCEEEGNYMEASKAHKQLGVLRKQEEKRQQKAIQARQISERQDVQLAHNMQFSEFNRSWDKYLAEYDNMAQMYIQQMTERHAVVLLEFQKQLRQELAAKPPKWSRELMDQRRQQHINASNKNYSVAQKMKKISDKNEERERKEMEQQQAVIFARREAKFRNHQQTELQALMKRIGCRRKEHIKQRTLDTKRLLQRNRNVQAVLESKQNAEYQKLCGEIKKLLYSSEILKGASAIQPNSQTQGSKPKKVNRSKSMGNSAHQQQQQYQQDDYQQYDQRQEYNDGEDYGATGGNDQYDPQERDADAEDDYQAANSAAPGTQPPPPHFLHEQSPQFV